LHSHSPLSPACPAVSLLRPLHFNTYYRPIEATPYSTLSSRRPGVHPHPHSFPTRRSSDLPQRLRPALLQTGAHRPGICRALHPPDRKSTRLNSSHVSISYAVFCLKKKIQHSHPDTAPPPIDNTSPDAYDEAQAHVTQEPTS